MYDLFNPAGLRVLEDRNGAVAFGWLSPRVLYARAVGCLSGELGRSFTRELRTATRGMGCFSYFGDGSALSRCDLAALALFQGFVKASRSSLVTLKLLAQPAESRSFTAKLVEPMELLTDPAEFDAALANVVPASHVVQRPDPVWHVRAPMRPEHAAKFRSFAWH